MWKLAVMAAILAILPAAAGAQQQPSKPQPKDDFSKQIVISLHWITDSHGCKVWDSKPAPNESVTWTGGCTDGYASGKGKLTWFVAGRPSGTYEGEMQGGHYEGQGTQIWSTGSRYDGAWRNDRADGYGTYRSVDGDVCTGIWVNGCMQGGGCRHSIGVPTCPPAVPR